MKDSLIFSTEVTWNIRFNIWICVGAFFGKVLIPFSEKRLLPECVHNHASSVFPYLICNWIPNSLSPSTGQILLPDSVVHMFVCSHPACPSSADSSRSSDVLDGTGLSGLASCKGPYKTVVNGPRWALGLPSSDVALKLDIFPQSFFTSVFSPLGPPEY